MISESGHEILMSFFVFGMSLSFASWKKSVHAGIWMFILTMIALMTFSGCATQRTLCEDLSPLDCKKMRVQMDHSMRPVFDPPFRPERWKK